MRHGQLGAGALVLVVAAAGLALGLPSIEREPVRVTNRNSGPRYDVEPERVKLNQAAPSARPADNELERPADSGEESAERPQLPPSGPSSSGAAPADQDQDLAGPTIGHMTIRRIFLVPVHQSAAGQRDQADQESRGDEPPPSFLMRPFWPFMTPLRAPGATADEHHQAPDQQQRPSRPLFGADQASRSPVAREDGRGLAASGSEREPLAFDPIQMMVEMMRQALSGQTMPPSGFQDLTNEASAAGGPALGDGRQEQPQPPVAQRRPGGELERPLKPTSQNETKEEVVEIDGKKFLRKTIVNKHVGENIVFMTRRLIFVPLNETEPGAAAEAPQTAAPSELSPEMPARPGVASEARPAAQTEQPVASSSPASETTTEAATVAPPKPSAATTTTTTELSPTTEERVATPTTSPAPGASSTGPSWVERMSEAIDKAAERIVEGAREQLTTTTSSTTERPAASS